VWLVGGCDQRPEAQAPPEPVRWEHGQLALIEGSVGGEFVKKWRWESATLGRIEALLTAEMFKALGGTELQAQAVQDRGGAATALLDLLSDRGWEMIAADSLVRPDTRPGAAAIEKRWIFRRRK
jgi:hypothetical protein